MANWGGGAGASLPTDIYFGWLPGQKKQQMWGHSTAVGGVKFRSKKALSGDLEDLDLDREILAGRWGGPLAPYVINQRVFRRWQVVAGLLNLEGAPPSVLIGW